MTLGKRSPLVAATALVSSLILMVAIVQRAGETVVTADEEQVVTVVSGAAIPIAVAARDAFHDRRPDGAPSVPVGERTSSDGEAVDPIAGQIRDPSWAAPAEEAVEAALRTIPYTAVGHRPRVRCAATRCQARGTIETGATAHNRAMAIRYLKDKEFAANLGQANALTDDVDVDERTGVFTIGFSRVRR